ncbi:MAG: hypothetical protein ACRDNB_07875 [Gaiellaceae bacterium]
MIDILRDAPPGAAVMILVGGGLWIAASVLRGYAYVSAAREQRRPEGDVRRWLAAEILGGVIGAAGLAWYVLAE